MSLQKRLHDAAEERKRVILPHFEHIAEVQGHVDAHAAEQIVPAISGEFCGMSITTFARGWHCIVTDKDVAGDSYPSVKRDIDELKYREQRKFVLRLTIWRGKKHPGRKPSFVDGKTLFFKETTDLKSYNGELQGATDMGDFVKIEGVDGYPMAKKAKTNGAINAPAKTPASTTATTTNGDTTAAAKAPGPAKASGPAKAIPTSAMKTTAGPTPKATVPRMTKTNTGN